MCRKQVAGDFLMLIFALIFLRSWASGPLRGVLSVWKRPRMAHVPFKENMMGQVASTWCARNFGGSCAVTAGRTMISNGRSLNVLAKATTAQRSWQQTSITCEVGGGKQRACWHYLWEEGHCS